jgi:hypothetical protein
MQRDQRKDRHRATPGDAEQRPQTPICYPTRYPQSRAIDTPSPAPKRSAMARPDNSATPRGPGRSHWPSDLQPSHSDGPPGPTPPGPETPGSADERISARAGTSSGVPGHDIRATDGLMRGRAPIEGPRPGQGPQRQRGRCSWLMTTARLGYLPH